MNFISNIVLYSKMGKNSKYNSVDFPYYDNNPDYLKQLKEYITYSSKEWMLYSEKSKITNYVQCQFFDKSDKKCTKRIKTGSIYCCKHENTK